MSMRQLCLHSRRRDEEAPFYPQHNKTSSAKHIVLGPHPGTRFWWIKVRAAESQLASLLLFSDSNRCGVALLLCQHRLSHHQGKTKTTLIHLYGITGQIEVCIFLV